MTFELDIERLKMNQLAEYQGRRPFSSEVIVWKHTLQTDCSIWITKAVSRMHLSYSAVVDASPVHPPAGLIRSCDDRTLASSYVEQLTPTTRVAAAAAVYTVLGNR